MSSVQAHDVRKGVEGGRYLLVALDHLPWEQQQQYLTGGDSFASCPEMVLVAYFNIACRVTDRFVRTACSFDMRRGRPR